MKNNTATGTTMNNATHSTIIELWNRLDAWCDEAEADRLADEWIDSEMLMLQEMRAHGFH